MKYFYKLLFIGGIAAVIFFFDKAFLADQSISVTGSVLPQASDFQLSVTANQADYFHQNDTVLYTITYGSRLYHSDTITLEAQWDEGTLADQTTPSVDMVNYIPDSATNAYASSSATVDLVNKTIRWNIAGFPANTTNQTVQFAVKLNDTYQGATLVRFPLTVHLYATNFTSPAQNLILNYLFDPARYTPQPNYLPTPTPTAVPAPLVFTNISFSGISATSFTFDAITNGQTKLKVLYGLSPDALTSVVTDPTLNYQHIITVPKLTPNTKYYVRFVATNTDGVSTTSDRYSFTTAQKGDQPQLDQQSITFVSADTVLFSPKPNTDASQTPILVLPQNTAYNFRMQITKPETVKRIQAILRNKYVLGITSADAAEPNTLVTNLIETQQGLFEGRLKSPSLPGTYQEFVRIYDTKGNITEHAVADVHVSAPLEVTNQQTKQPIEAAQIYLYYFNTLQQQFMPLPPQLFPVKNPSYTDVNGQLILPLPQGRYKATITAIGYKSKEVIFALDGTHEYPTIQLIPQPFNLLTVGKYYLAVIDDVLSSTKQYIQGISYSVRFFDLNALLATTFLVFLTLFAFSRKIHIPVRSFFSYFHHISQTSIQKPLRNHVTGQLVDDETGEIIPNANVYLLNRDNGDIVSHMLSTRTGTFMLHTLPQQAYDIQVMAEGFEPMLYHELDMNTVGINGYTFRLKRRPVLPSLIEQITMFTEKLLSVGFEALLLVSFIFELSLGFALGFEKTLPFLLFSSINLFLWILHLMHVQAHKEAF